MRAPFGLPVAVAAAVLLFATSGCGSTDDGAPAGSPSPTESAPSASGTGGTASASPTGGGIPSPPADLRARPAVVAAIADAAGRAGVAPESVVIAGWSPVTWTDGSLGCPQEGMAYIQALQEGELLLLRTGTRTLEYHAAGAGPFSYCANPSKGYTVS